MSSPSDTHLNNRRRGDGGSPWTPTTRTAALVEQGWRGLTRCSARCEASPSGFVHTSVCPGLHQLNERACSGAPQAGLDGISAGFGWVCDGCRSAHGWWASWRLQLQVVSYQSDGKRCSYQPQASPRLSPFTARGVWFLGRHPARVAWRSCHSRSWALVPRCR